MRFNFETLLSWLNDVYVPLLKNHDRYLVLYGGAGSGKSHFIAQKLLLRILLSMERGYKERFLALRKTQPAVKRSVFALFQEYISKWGLTNMVKVNLTELSYTFANGSQILCMGLDDPEKLKSIEGVTGEWLEESTEFTSMDFTQCDLRLRGQTPRYKQIILSFNPMDALLWLNDRFFLANGEPKDTEDSTVLRTTWRDNRFIDTEYVKVLEDLKEQDSTLYQIYNLGIWGILKNLIYSNYDVIKDDEWPANCDQIIYGLDFAFSHETALIEIGLKDEVVYERELLYEKKLTNAMLIEKLHSLIPNPTDYIYADSAEPNRIEEIYQAGFNCFPSDKSVKDGIDFVKRKRVRITESSENHLKEKRTYKYKEDKYGNVLDEPVKAFDDLQDAERYALYTHLGHDRFIQVFT